MKFNPVLIFCIVTFSRFFDYAKANSHKCPHVKLDSNNFDFIKSESGIWYMTHMTNSDTLGNVACINKKVQIKEDKSIEESLSLGYLETKNVTVFNLSGIVEADSQNGRILTLKFRGLLNWDIGPVYVLEDDPSSYTLHWQCFPVNGKITENFFLYSRTPHIKNSIYERVKAKMAEHVPEHKGTLDPIVRCSEKPK